MRACVRWYPNHGTGDRFSNVPKLLGPEKPYITLRPAYSVKVVFSDVVKGIIIKITPKYRASRRLRFEDTKRIMSPEMRPRCFGTFEKPVPCVTYFHLDLAIFSTERKMNIVPSNIRKVLKFGMKQLGRGQIPLWRVRKLPLGGLGSTPSPLTNC